MDKEAARAEAIAKIQKAHGKESIMKMSDGPATGIDVIPTGSLGLDIGLGVGGYPRGRIIEIFGPESSGKTTMTLHAIAECQQAGGYCAFVDAEHALDTSYARKLGVDVDELYISQPDYGEQALEIVEKLIDSNAFDMVVVDSVANLTPKAEIEGEMGDATMGKHARLMSQALRKLTAKTNNTKTVLFFINQIRSKIGVMFGSPETTTGGNALKFYCSVRLDVRKVSAIKRGEDVIGHQARITVKKNKVGPPFRKAEFDMLYGEGINYLGEVLDYAVHLKLVEKSGAWYSYEGNRLGQGRDKTLAGLRDNPELVGLLTTQIRKHYRLEE